MCFTSPPGHQSIHDPKIPYVGPIHGGLRIGMSVYVKGKVHPNIDRFHINFQYAARPGSDIALHFNPRFKHEQVVVFNNFHCGGWKREERPSGLPFTVGGCFELLITITREGYQVNVNGQPFHLFKHRMPVGRVRTLSIAGDVSIQIVNFIGGGHSGVCGNPREGQLVKIPHVERLRGGCRPGTSLHVQGTVPQRLRRFHIDFRCAEVRCADIALHFKVMYRHHGMVVLNTFQHGHWKREERYRAMPFRRGEAFDLVITVTSEGFQVNVNDQHFCMFKHRMPVNRVAVIEMAGEVSVQTFNITEGGQVVGTGRPGRKELVIHRIPYVGPLSCGLVPGMTLFFHGTVHPRIRRFHINLQCGEARCSDIALHFNPRFCPCEIVVLNNYHHGWKREERHAMPFRRGESFKLIIVVTVEGYQLNVDGNPYYLFKHRTPLNRVRALAIAGDVTMHRVTCAKAQGEQAGPAVAIPHVRSIQGGLQLGMRLVFKGTVPQSLNRFHINLKYAEAGGSPIALHVNPRYQHKKVVVLNSFGHGRWAKEVRPKAMPFPNGEDFELFIDVTEAGYQLVVNGENFELFEHRMAFQKVTVLEICGQVSMQAVDIIKGEAKAVAEPSKIQILTAPYVRPIFGGFRTGMCVYFQGTIPHKINSFFINFHCGAMHCCDKAFHLRVSFTPMELLVCNNYLHGRWRKEDRVTEMPFARGKSFELIIRITSEGYQLNVNGHLVHTFLHRIPVGRVTRLEIAGDVSVQSVDILEAGEGDMQGQAGVRELEITKIPYLGPIFGLRPGVSLLFRGRVHEKINRFHINLQCGSMRCADIALHFNPRFKHGEVVVLNNYRHGWKREERHAMPFTKGADFELVIAITNEGYQVNVNDKPFCLFKHRTQVERVKALAIAGDVTIHSASIIEDEEEGVPKSPVGGTAVAVPCIRQIPGGLKTGMTFCFKASIPENITRFHINFQCGQKDGSVIACHFNPRLSPKAVVVFNTFRRHWETEDRVYKMPLTKGQSFVLVITITSKGYEVNIDGQHFHTFRHRMPIQRVSCIAIAGDITVEKMDITGGIAGVIEKQPGTIVNTPFVRPIHVGLRPGMSVYVQGTIPQKIVRFHVNFKCGSMRLSDIAFHFNPRFCPCELVVHNSFKSGNWRREERAHEMPFRKGEEFELLFVITSKGYQVNVNGRPFYTFCHRIPVDRVTSLEIGGQVHVQTVDFIEAAQTDTVGRVGAGEIMISRIPHVGPIVGGLRRGTCLVFQGTIPKRINRFHINLQCGEMACSDKALHLKVQFGCCQLVVFNSFQRRWRREERVHKMPFHKGASFELKILVRSKGYQIYVNGDKFYFFRHRISLDRVKSLAIGGDVTIQSLNVTEAEKEVTPKEPVAKEALSVPYLMPMTVPLSLGMSVVVKGTVPSNCVRFSVNLLCGKKENADNAYHFNPRFDEGLVVLNTKKGGWQKEIRPAGLPFTKEQSFKLTIRVTAAGYQTRVNGVQFCTFSHRMAIGRVKSVWVVGDVTLHSVDIIGGRQGGIPITPGAKEVAINTPYLRPVVDGLKTGMSVYIQGTIPSRLKRFAVNFRCGDLKCSDIALHFNPRFCPYEVVVLNNYRHGWKREERVKRMPFTKGEDFEMLIVITPVGYQVHVGGRVFHTFRHRVPVERVTNIQITGGIFVRNIDIIGGVERGVAGLGREELVVNSIPFVGPITGGLTPGACLVFQGTVHSKIDRFHINLRCGQIKCSDIALHFNPRFKHRTVVVMNTYRHGWKKEERVQQMPFTKGESFELVFVITPEGYQVLVNGSFFYLFKHRIPVQRVRAVEIRGAVSIQSLNIIRMSTPYKQPISCPLKPGMLLTLQGTVPYRADRFSVNLLCGDQKGCDTALHINPRFAQNVLLFNSFQNGSWQTEQRAGKMPFTRGASFELGIAVTAEGYQIIVNDSIIDKFVHRVPLEQVTNLAIFKDVSIYDIDISEREPGVLPVGPGGLEGMAIPHERPITVRPGMSLLFQGMIPTEKCRFAINFRCGEKIIAMHFNPRFDSEVVVVFNTHGEGGWQKEERPKKMPFRLGESFEVFILVKANGYQTIVNGCKFHLYKHRVPMDQVTTLQVTKEVILQNIEISEGATGGIAICPGVPEPLPLPEIAVVGNIPYVRPLSNPFKPGMSVYFQGIVAYKPRRFSVNFKCGDAKGSDIALHFNPRFSPCAVVVLNSYQGGWKNEERVKDMLFNKGESFEMVIFITAQGYKVTINGCDFYTFNHRIDVGQVTALEVRGDVSVETLEIIEGLGEGAVVGPDEEEPEEIPDEEPDEEELVISRVPQLRPVYKGLNPGMILNFKGIVPPEIDRFAINLKCAEKPGCDIALHVNPRFPEGVVVLNSFKNGSWEQEERPTGMPFTKGEKFELVINITPDGYQLIVNSVDFHLFKHRIGVEEVKALEMDEDIIVNIIPGEQEAAKPEKEKPAVPFVQTFESSLQAGMALYFNGSVPADLKRFSINLCCGENDVNMTQGIALHFNPRFDTNVVVFNSLENGGWQKEERPTDMPFARGEDFEVLFVITAEGYKVFVNGVFFHLFNHRIPLENVKSVLIKKEVFIRTFDIIAEYVPEAPEKEEEEEEEEEVVSVPQYEQPIDGVLTDGKSLYFQGIIPDELDCFVINLAAQDSDIALSFTARLDTCVLLLNSYQGGQWQEEVKVETMPFLEGESFELVFVITTVGYKIVINGEEVYTFNHRIALELVRAVRIDGDVSIQTVNTIATPKEEEFVEPDIDDWLTIQPYVQSTPGNLKIGQTVYFQGSLPEEITSFSVGLQYGHTDNCDVALHLNAQFEPEEAVVFNHRKDGTWGEEEKLQGTPFHMGEHFEIVISITDVHCQVTVNGTALHTFKHRISITDVCAVRLDGNVSMETITVIETQEVVVPGGDDSMISISPGDVTIIEECIQVASYIEPITRLRPETTLYFQGSIPEEIDGFCIDLMCGEGADSNIAFRFNPMFGSSEVLFNSFNDSAWGEEERISMKNLAKGQNFELMVFIAAEHFQVKLGGEEFHNFKYRMDVSQVCAVKITGNVQMQTLNIIEKAVEVQLEGDMEMAGQVEMITGEPIYTPPVPYTGAIASGMSVKKTVVITGSTLAEANSFSCNFMTGGGDIAFALNPRIAEGVVVRNSCLGGSWGEEERDAAYNPFEKDAQFEMFIRCGQNKFTVFVNGQHMCDFVHRHKSITDIDKLEVTGDVQLSYVVL